MRSVVLSMAPESGVRVAAYYRAGGIVAVSGIWGNEDQNLAWVRFGFRALTRTPLYVER